MKTERDDNLNNFAEQDNSTSETIFLNEKVKDCIKPLTHLEIVKVLLRERGMKQTELADRIGLSRQALHNYLRGYWSTPQQIKLRIAQALSVDSSVIWDLK